MRLPRVRITVRRMMIAVAASAFLLALGSCADRVWSGHASVPLEFLILDTSTGRPIVGASVSLGEVHRTEYAASTGLDGRAKLVRYTEAGLAQARRGYAHIRELEQRFRCCLINVVPAE